MTDEQIKEITIAAIQNGLLYRESDNEKTAKEVAKFINTLAEKVK